VGARPGAAPRRVSTPTSSTSSADEFPGDEPPRTTGRRRAYDLAVHKDMKRVFGCGLGGRR